MSSKHLSQVPGACASPAIRQHRVSEPTDPSQEGLKLHRILKTGFKSEAEGYGELSLRRLSRQVETMSQTAEDMPQHELIYSCGPGHVSSRKF